MTYVSAKISLSTEKVKNELSELQTAFDVKLKIEKAIEDWQKLSPLTLEIEEADKRQDTALTALRSLAKSQTFELSKQNADAAKRVYEMLMSYKNVNSKPYSQQTGDIESILRELATRYSGDVTWMMQYASSTTAHIAELKNASIAFRDILEKRDEYYDTKPEVNFKEIRKEIEPIFFRIAEVLEANSETNEDPGFIALIKKINHEIHRLNREHRFKHYDITKAQPAPIPVQKYTGLPVTPVPVILFKTEEKTVPLEIGRDFNISFTDNVEVGNASLKIHGIRKFKGSKFFTFVIERTL
jgi:hypothetical protein